MRFQQAPYRIADVVALLFIAHGNTSFGSLAPIIPYRSCKHYLEVWHGQLLSCFVLLVLTLDVLLYLLCIFPCRVHIVPTAPEFPVPVFIFLLRELLVQHQAAFSFHLPHETCYCYLWRYLDQHVDVVRAYLRFDNLDPFPIAQRPQNASNFSSFLSEEHFPSVFWRKHYMIFAIPTAMR